MGLRRLVSVLAVAALAALAAPFAVNPPAAAVTGGRASDPGEWPWQVALRHDGLLLCGGTLVAPDIVLTAAHCTDAQTDFEVVAGSVDLANPAVGQFRTVVRVDQHEAYDPDSFRNDISLLYLDSPFVLDADVAVVELAGPTETAALGGADAPAVVTGFGAIGDLARVSPRLLEADVHTFADDVCAADYASLNALDGASQICAGLDIGSVDACYGDSGGPLVVPVDDDRTSWLQVGIVSFGAGCGEPGYPTVYTEVAAFADWLASRGVVTPSPQQFDGTGARIPARGTMGKSGPYALAIEVPPFDTALLSAVVRLDGLTHERAADLDIWLMSPEGTVVSLVSDAGGEAPISGGFVVADGAPAATDAALPALFGPTDLEADGQSVRWIAASTLTALLGENPAGRWQLFIGDDQEGASGSLASWSLLLR